VYLRRLQQKHARVHEATKGSKRAAGLAARRARKALFMQTHGGIPRLFTQAEVADLNASRSPLDQIELQGTSPGLLRHHCCFPRCPLYLVDLRTAKDRAVGTASAQKGPHAPPRRHGLLKHLSFYTEPDCSYLPGFHATALQILKSKPRIQLGDFIHRMAHAYDMVYNERKSSLEGRPNRGSMSHGEALRLIEELWGQQVGGMWAP